MRYCTAAFFGVIILLTCDLAAADAIDADAIRFRSSIMEEGYMIVIDTGPSFRLAARFVVGRDEKGEYLTRIVRVNEGQGPMERLPLTMSARFLQKFRTFDWSAKPKKPSLVFGCVSGMTTRVAFKARADESYREIEADGTLMPSLADFLDVIVSDVKDPNQITEGK